MRKLTDHVVNPANDRLKIAVLDAPGPGGASHCYSISGADVSSNPSLMKLGIDPGKFGNIHTLVILFQNGPISEGGNGVNGITHEALLAILIDRLRGFQGGGYACRENALALTKLEEAQHWLHHRTRARMARGVEGTHKV